MAIRKPNGGAKAASTAPLTSVQDTRSRGNGNGNGERVLMSFKIPSDLKMMVWLRQKHASRKGRQRANRKRRPKRIGLKQNRPQRDRSSRYAR